MRLAESRKYGGVVSFSGVSRAQTAWERGIEPSQTPKFLPPFPWEGRRLFLVTVALSPSLLGWGLSPVNPIFQILLDNSHFP